MQLHLLAAQVRAGASASSHVERRFESSEGYDGRTASESLCGPARAQIRVFHPNWGGVGGAQLGLQRCWSATRAQTVARQAPAYGSSAFAGHIPCCLAA